MQIGVGDLCQICSIYAAIAPETGTTEYNRFLNLLGDATVNSNVSTRLGELGGETVP